MSDESNRKNNPMDIGGNSKDTNQSDKQTPPSANTATNTPSKCAASPQNKQNQNFKYYWKKTNKFAKDWKHVIELAGLIGLIVYCALNAGELWVFNGERITMQRDSKTSQIRNLVEQTNTERQLKVLQTQLDEMRQSRIQDERAWVFVTIPNDALEFSGTNITITLTDKNIGKTPAIVTHTFGTAAIDQKQIPSHDQLGAETSLMLIPNQQGDVIMKLPAIVGTAIVQNIKIYIYGTVYYRDINGVNHWSQFCFCFDQNGRLMIPQIFHNSCDDLENTNSY